MAPSTHPAADGLARMRQLEKSLRELPESETTLSDKRLESLDIHKAPQLNIDNPDASDDWPVFFQPLGDSQQFRTTLKEAEKEIRYYSICPYKKEHADRLTCATQTLSWFHSAARAVYPEDEPQWAGTSYGPGHRFPSYFGREVHMKKYGCCPSPPPPEWMTKIASGVTEAGYRHVSLWVVDNTSHEKKPGEPLRSEIASAVRFVVKQMELTKLTCRTTPVIIYSMHHNDTARITQVWWDGKDETIRFRQSRILHIASDSFTAPDVLLLVRWKACTPLLEPKQACKPDETAPKPAVPVPGVSPAQSGATQPSGGPKTGTGAAHTVKTTTSPHKPNKPEGKTTTGTPAGNVTPPRQTTTLRKTDATVGNKHSSSPPQRSSTPGGNAAAVKSTTTGNKHGSSPPQSSSTPGGNVAAAKSTTPGTTPRVNVLSSSTAAVPNRTTNLPNRGPNNGKTGSHTQRPDGRNTPT